MPFSELLKKKVRARAKFRCCVCRQPHGIDVEIHHIVPQADGGEDTEDNAAPLCPNCHSGYGANPEKRKIIREMRDDWYKHCSQPSVEMAKIVEISEDIKNLATKEDIERLAVRNNISPQETHGVSSMQNFSRDARYSFTCDDFIHPLIVRELLGWVSDRGQTIVSIDISNANLSNQFYGEFTTSDMNTKTQVKWKGEHNEYFVYSHVGTSPSGVEMVECYDCDGGSGVFGNVGLFSLGYDQALGEDGTGKISTRERTVLKILGSIGLGDRYNGEIKYANGFLVIGPDNGWFSRGQEAARRLPVL